MWVVRVGGDAGELRPWHFIYVYSIDSRLIIRVRSHALMQNINVENEFVWARLGIKLTKHGFTTHLKPHKL